MSPTNPRILATLIVSSQSTGCLGGHPQSTAIALEIADRLLVGAALGAEGLVVLGVGLVHFLLGQQVLAEDAEAGGSCDCHGTSMLG